MSDHARLSCSAAHRWTACPGAPRLEAQFPRQESIYAAEGTTAHALLETALLLSQPLDQCLTLVPGATEVMAEALQPVVDWIQSQMADHPGAELYLERRVDPGSPLGRDDLWGTADILVFFREDRRLLVGDLKFGAGLAVEVEDNPQIRLYALGALALADYPVEAVTLAILQPRAPHADGPVRVATLTRAALDAFGETIRTAAALTDEDDAPLNAGEHCKFCRAAGGCAALADYSLAVAREAFREVDAPLRPERIGYLLGEAETVRGWLKALEEHALTLARTGTEIPGWKLAQRQGNRAWIDADAALPHLAVTYGVDPDLLAPRKLGTPAHVERVVKAETKQKADLSALVKVPELAPRLVPLKSPGGDVFADAAAWFAGLEEEIT